MLGIAVTGLLAYSYGKSRGLRRPDEIKGSTTFKPAPEAKPMYTIEPTLWVED